MIWIPFVDQMSILYVPCAIGLHYTHIYSLIYITGVKKTPYPENVILKVWWTSFYWMVTFNVRHGVVRYRAQSLYPSKCIDYLVQIGTAMTFVWHKASHQTITHVNNTHYITTIVCATKVNVSNAPLRNCDIATRRQPKIKPRECCKRYNVARNMTEFAKFSFNPIRYLIHKPE